MQTLLPHIPPHDDAPGVKGGASLSTIPAAEERLGRFEPQSLDERSGSGDPYSAWLEQRQAERELEERPPVRWVMRHPDGGPTITLSGLRFR